MLAWKRTVGAAEAGAALGELPSCCAKSLQMERESAWLGPWEGPIHVQAGTVTVLHVKIFSQAFGCSPAVPAVQAHVYNLIRCHDLSLWVLFLLA